VVPVMRVSVKVVALVDVQYGSQPPEGLENMT
jgi:hypothetical protein